MTGFIDLQVNGYAGVDFNDEHVSDQQWLDVCARLTADGVDKILATVITAPIDRMIARIERIAIAMETFPEVARMVAGIHVEGPFISPVAGFVGAHPTAAVMPADVATADRLLDAGRGHVRLLTLAPECDAGARLVRHLSDQGIVVAGGHSDASLDQLQQAVDQGMSLYTHLGNGCPSQLNRHDNIIQRVIRLSDQMYVSLIADGHHVPNFALANYLRCIPHDRVIIVTDAINAAGLGPGKYSLAGQRVEVDPDGAAWAEGRQHFAGCATPMQTMAEILRDQLGVGDELVDRWTRVNPGRLLG
ncbi:N-acetylglucosamine-6-phosphate deacetylase [Rubripirellula lacrimiformis]|uniref:N-acetylglucosamine-6-phosphate deacetylase n=1 Tax=Rubripirellula lacrimiformis TaxID=1930273 RepID=A0A517NL74_9BACT|nr:N-acetylglucosamine-6-phosphate deacetylase [Rubripirellula lacrimiformis]QDT07884.1 N-acetylglucosamine-6-phosphate deacetylase [Rubripirellula lacrimiformis]